MWLVLAGVLLAGGDGLVLDPRDDVSEIDRQTIERAIHNELRFDATSNEPAPYTFFPMSGINGKDMFLSNAVDLDPTTGIRDFDCTSYTYDGHRGHDMLLLSFRQQDIGAPVYAPLAGTVVETRDGEPDRHLAWDPNNRANYVLLRHEGTHFTVYYHFRRGSVAVVPGQVVSAGTQLGLVGSSGFSSWPHLHFESIHATRAYEPSAGPCRQGPSFWTVQPPIARAFYVAEFGFSPLPYEESATTAGVAEDLEPRTGTYTQGSAVHFRAALKNVPPQTTAEMRLVRPDGTIAATSTRVYGNANLFRSLWTWGSFNLGPAVLGEWRVEIAFNGTTMINAPFQVVTATTPIENRAPRPIAVAIKPAPLTANDVPRCEIETSLVHEDPDYDVMAYRYQWTVDGSIVREVTSAGLADVLPKGVARVGDQIVCRVVPFDGALEGPSASAQAAVIEPQRRRAARH